MQVVSAKAGGTPQTNIRTMAINGTPKRIPAGVRDVSVQ